MKRREFLAGGAALSGVVLGGGGGALPGLLPGAGGNSRAEGAPGPAAGEHPPADPAARATGGRQSADFEALAGLVSTRMAELGVPGVAFGVHAGGRTTTRGFGVTNLSDPQPVTADTVFPIASISKTVTATAVMRLVEEGRLELDAPVQRYLPGFRVADPTASRTITVAHLLTHTPGFEGQLGTEDRGDETLAVFTASLGDLPQLAPPGAVWSYNNAGFGVAGRVIEVVTGTDVHRAFRDLVFEPLGLERAFSRLGDVITHRFAVGHRAGDGEAAEVIPSFSLFPNVPAGGTAMSLASLLAYATFHLGEGGSGVPSLATRERMRTPRLRKNATDDEIGLAWQLRRLGGVLTAAHGGTLGGHCLHLQLVPERSLAFAILTNHRDGWRLIQEVERATLLRYGGLSLAPGQAICHRGVNEDMSAHATPLARQPDPAGYVGTYHRPPVGSVEVRAGSGGGGPSGAILMVDDTPVVFWGPDLAYATAGGFVGRPYEFVRDGGGAVRWVRVNGRIARKG